MCGRFAFTGIPDALIEAHDLERRRLLARYNIGPMQTGTIVLFDPDRQRVEDQDLNWGLVPTWAKDKSMAARCINARAETVSEKPTFRAAFRYRRCLVPVSGFYEWRREGKTKTPFYFSSPTNVPLILAGLWEDWTDHVEHYRSFTILTTQANTVMQPIHDRMPVILPPDAWNRWLNPKPDHPTGLDDLLRPAPDDYLQCNQVSDYVNRVENEGPECVKAV